MQVLVPETKSLEGLERCEHFSVTLYLPFVSPMKSSYRLVKLLTVCDPEVMANLCGDLGVGGPPPPPMGLSISDSSVSDTRRSPQNGDEGLATMVVGDGGGGLSNPPHFR